MKTKNHELSSQQKTLARRVVGDPLLFATAVLGAQLWERQIEILRSIQNYRRTAIRSCHGAGKTYVLAIAALWWLARYHDGIVLTTSSTFRQVKTQLWSEIHRLIAQAKVHYPELKNTELRLRDDSNLALGFSTDRAANFQGYHGKHVLILADEAPGIESGIWDAIAGTMAGGKVHIVMAGNPTLPSGTFYNAFTRERELWNCIRIDAFDSPNLKGIGLDELLQMDPTEGGPLDQNPVPYLVTRRWIFDQYRAWWHGDEGSSPQWLSRVRGQFPDQAQNALVKLRWLERAKERALLTPMQDRAVSLVAGVDVGGGEAETVVYVCESKPHDFKIIAMGVWRSGDTRGEVVRFLAPYRERLRSVRVDAIGMGYNFGLHLRDQRFPVELVNVGMACESRPERRENDPAGRFVNLKAQYYQELADALERDEVHGLTDDITIGQLAGLLYEIDSHGRIKIESKESARARGVPSPDRAEALMLALGRPHSVGGIILVPIKTPRAQSHSTECNERAPYETGFVLSADQSDENDLPPNVCRVKKSRRFGSGGW
jgi:phage terminase large subunit